MRNDAATLTGYFAFLLQCIGLLWFSKGFFPHKKVVLQGYGEAHSDDAPAIFDRLVFVVVDALRSDFIFGPQSDMHHMHNMINEQTLVPFTGKASTPTVTLPRLKCLTTGAITGFLDAILNIAESDTSSTVAFQDSWIQQMVKQDREIHMYGDDTWMRLFPGVFSDFEGTSSFFVKDFTEVDNNVTRHLAHELKSGTWDTLVLHYLGLDHIGHLEGPNSQHMSFKQVEMDNIVHGIYEAMNVADEARSCRTLTILLGDHGMTADGNHGGASESETSTGIAFLSPLFQKVSRPVEVRWPTQNATVQDLELYHSIIQSDVVPALSLALGLPIPINSLGIIPEPILSLWSIQDRKKALLQNARQLQRLIQAGSSAVGHVDTSLPCRTVSPNGRCELADIELTKAITELDLTTLEMRAELYRVMHIMQEELLSASNNFDISTMQIGLLLLFLAFILALTQLRLKQFVRYDYLTLLIPFFHSLTAFATSFVEEEHVYWYFIGAVYLFFLSLGKVRNTISSASMAGAISSMIAFRILRRYNQTGQKFAGAPDIASYLDQFEHFSSISFSLAMSVSIKDMLAKLSIEPLESSISLVASVAIIVFRLGEGQYPANAVKFAWTMMLCLLGASSFTKSGRSSGKYDSLAQLLFLLQSRPQNYLVLLLFRTINSFLQDNHDTTWTTTLFLILEQVSFFALGNSNALSGLDLSQAYNGVTEYNEGIVGSLLFISSFIGPIYWHLQLLSFLDRQDKNDRQGRGRKTTTRVGMTARQTARLYVTIFSIMYATALATSCYALRHHLFVFSVFSPKLLFTGAWTVFYGLALLTI